MEAMGIVRSRDVNSQSGLAGVGGAGQFDSNIPAKINNWWSAGAAFSARLLHRVGHFAVRSRPYRGSAVRQQPGVGV